MAENKQYQKINYLRGQSLKAEDVNRLQDWIASAEEKILPERIYLGGTGIPEEDDGFFIGISSEDKKIYFKNGENGWEEVLPHLPVLKENESYYKQIPERKVAQFLYTDFKKSDGKYKEGRYEKNSDNKIVFNSSSDYHSSDPLRVKKGSIYIGYIPDKEFIGCFFDEFKTPKQIVTKNDIKDISKADGVEFLYRIENPGFEYFSYNLADNSESYRQFFSSRNMLALEDSGNYLVYEDDPIYQQKKDKKLLVVGASGVSRNRGKYDGEFSISFQEYLILWYKEMRYKGYSGCSWRPGEGNSIPIQLLKETNLADYDDFLFIPSTAGLRAYKTDGDDSLTAFVHSTTLNYIKTTRLTVSPYNMSIEKIDFFIPALGSHTNLPANITDPSKFSTKDGSYFDGLNYVIDQIRQKRKNKETNIYIANGAKKSKRYYDAEKYKKASIVITQEGNKKPTAYLNTDEGNLKVNKVLDYYVIKKLNEEVELLCKESSCKLIDLANMGIDKHNYSNFIHNDGTHLNNKGNRLQGLAIRKQIIGI